MNVLVLGGSYFIGRTVVDRLLQDGHTVTVLNRGSRSVAGVEQVVADRGHADALHRALAGRTFDWVVDTSCYTAKQAALAFEAVGGRFRSWMYLSTAAVYPGGTAERVSEDAVGPGREWEDYGWNKLSAERELQDLLAGSGRHLVVLRPPYVYGPLNPLPREQWLWARMLQGKPIWMPGAGATPLHFVHVSDLAEAVVLTLQHGAAPLDVFNVAQEETPSIREYLELLAEVAGVEPMLRPVDYRRMGLDVRSFFPFRDYPCLLSTDRLANTHGWGPHFTMRDGLGQTFSGIARETFLAAAAEIELEPRLLQAF
jgi:nucleoside-diphosphate-sugar epimerase